jgi:hypothetical protein
MMLSCIDIKAVRGNMEESKYNTGRRNGVVDTTLEALRSDINDLKAEIQALSVEVRKVPWVAQGLRLTRLQAHMAYIWALLGIQLTLNLTMVVVLIKHVAGL